MKHESAKRIYTGLAGAILVGLCIALLLTFGVSAERGYRILITTNSAGEFWPEIGLFTFALGLGVVVTVDWIREAYR